MVDPVPPPRGGGNLIEIVVEGYVRPQPDGALLATATCTLVTTATGLRVLVDPGSNGALLRRGLAALGVRPSQIAYVFITHWHLDHALNAGLFPRARVVDAELIAAGDLLTPRQHLGDYIPGTDLRVLLTPGHDPAHASLLVPTAAGTVVIAGDVFWWTDGDTPTLDLDYPDPYARDPAQLRRSRQSILALADWIVPGHGPLLPAPAAVEFRSQVHPAEGASNP